MAEENNNFGLDILLGESAIPSPRQSPEEAIKSQYDEQMQNQPSSFDQLISSVQTTPVENPTLDAYARGMGAADLQGDTFAASDRIRFGDAPDQQFVDPAEMISSAGQRVERGLKAGWGDLLVGTGDAIDFVSARIKPGDGDLTTSLGSWLKEVGTEYQKENALILSEDLQDITWQDMFNGEFWNSKISRLVPYAASFILPYGGGSFAATRALGRFGPKALKAAANSGKYGRAARGVGLKDVTKGKPGSGVLGKLAIDAGKKGYVPTKLLRNTTGYIGGGFTANMFEGAFLAGEAYQEMANDVDVDGNLMFTPKEAAQNASGVMIDNAKWVGVDILQYGILFGGAGRGIMGRLTRNSINKTDFAQNMKGLTGMMVRKVIPGLPAAAGYATAEGLTEGFQEVYQEWAKYKAIQEAKGLDYDSWTSWLKEAPLGENSQLRDIFWSSVGLGGAMGGVRGYFDAAAERKASLDKKIDAYNNVLELMKEGETLSPEEYTKRYEQSIDNLIASNVWNYSGDGSVAMAIIDNMVKDNKMTEEDAASYKSAIEQAEKNYQKHSVNTGLTEAGAEQAFFVETVLSSLNAQKEQLTSDYNAFVEQQKKVIKSDESKLNQILEQAEIEYQGAMETIDMQITQQSKRLEDIYTRKLDTAPTAKSTGKRDKRFKQEGITKDEFELFTQEGEKQKQEREKAETDKKKAEEKTVTEQVKDAGTKALDAVKNLKLSEITSGAKKKLVEAVQAGRIAAKKALEIVGTGIGKVINNRDVNSAIRTAEKERDKEETVDTEFEDVTDQSDVKKKERKVVPKTKSYQATEKTLEKGTRTIKGASIDKGSGPNYTI